MREFFRVGRFMPDKTLWFAGIMHLYQIVRSHRRNVDRPFHSENMSRLINNQCHEAKDMLAADLSARQINIEMVCFPSTITRMVQKNTLTGSVDDQS